MKNKNKLINLLNEIANEELGVYKKPRVEPKVINVKDIITGKIFTMKEWQYKKYHFKRLIKI